MLTFRAIFIFSAVTSKSVRKAITLLHEAIRWIPITPSLMQN